MKIIRPVATPAVPKFEPFAITVDTSAEFTALRRAIAQYSSGDVRLAEASYGMWRVLDDETARQEAR
jgi:hypothetical protein